MYTQITQAFSLQTHTHTTLVATRINVKYHTPSVYLTLYYITVFLNLSVWNTSAPQNKEHRCGGGQNRVKRVTLISEQEL